MICHSEASYQKIDKFAFEALCILGDDYEPCFESASIDTYSYDKGAFALMLREYKEAFALENKINTNTPKDKEGVDKLNYKLFGEELAESLDKVLRDEESVSSDWGEIPRYWFVDYDPDANETFCYDDKEKELVSFTFTVNGDVVTVDFNTRKKKKYTIVDFDDGTASPIDNFIKIGEYMAETKNQKSLQDAKDSYETQISERNGVINSLSAEVADLREYKKNIEHETFIQTLDGVFSNFADLHGIDEYDRLLNSFEEYKNGRLDAEFEYTEDSLTEKCYAIKGKNIQTKATYSKQKQQAPTPKLTITHQDPKESKDELPYNGYFEQF